MPLLTSSLLRSIALPLRTASPKLYIALNRVRGKLMTRGRDVAPYQSAALDRFCKRVPIRGRRILEIGTDRDRRVLRFLAAEGAAFALGVNNDSELQREAAAAASHAAFLFASADELPLPDQSFDAIFSVATFEHIADLPRALREMHRVLRPGGVLYTNFGPIWSGAKGHHLRVQVGDEEARHTLPDRNPLPDFCHLLMSPDELRAALIGRTSERLREPIVWSVYEDPTINRLFCHQYLELIEASPFRIESIVPERDPVPLRLRRILEFKYPKESAFDVTNVEMVLVRD